MDFYASWVCLSCCEVGLVLAACVLTKNRSHVRERFLYFYIFICLCFGYVQALTLSETSTLLWRIVLIGFDPSIACQVFGAFAFFLFFYGQFFCLRNVVGGDGGGAAGGGF